MAVNQGNPPSKPTKHAQNPARLVRPAGEGFERIPRAAGHDRGDDKDRVRVGDDQMQFRISLQFVTGVGKGLQLTPPRSRQVTERTCGFFFERSGDHEGEPGRGAVCPGMFRGDAAVGHFGFCNCHGARFVAGRERPLEMRDRGAQGLLIGKANSRL